MLVLITYRVDSIRGIPFMTSTRRGGGRSGSGGRSGGNLAPSLGGTEKIFADQDDVFFGKNFHFCGKKF